MRRLLSLVTLIVLASSCASGPQVRLLASEDLPAELYDESRGPRTEIRSVEVTIYLARTTSEGRLLDPVQLGTVNRRVQSRRQVPEVAASEVLKEPGVVERQAGYRTTIPTGTEALGVQIRDGIADVNLSAQFESAAAELLQVLRVAQIVWTMTALPEIDAIRFRIHGAPQPVVDQDGVAHESVTRAQYSELAPRGSDLGEVSESQIRAD